MKKEKILVIGAGGHAQVVIDIIEQGEKYEIGAIIAEKNEEKDELFGYRIYKGDDYLDSFYNKGIKHIAIGIGGYKDNLLRKKVFNKVKDIGFQVPPQIHPSAVISSTCKIGDGSVIFAGVILNPEVVIGENTIIATGATIDHKTIINNHVLVSAGVTVGAYSIIKEGALLALGSNVISGIEIGEYTLVAAGAVVVNNIEANTVVFGIPAKSKK